jgi:hypothetical protein
MMNYATATPPQVRAGRRAVRAGDMTDRRPWCGGSGLSGASPGKSQAAEARAPSWWLPPLAIASAVITIEAAIALRGALTLAQVISARAEPIGGLVLIGVGVAVASGIV